MNISKCSTNFQDIFKDTFWFVERLEVVSLATVHGIFGSAVVSWRALESETKKESLKKEIQQTATREVTWNAKKRDAKKKVGLQIRKKDASTTKEMEKVLFENKKKGLFVQQRKMAVSLSVVSKTFRTFFLCLNRKWRFSPKFFCFQTRLQKKTQCFRVFFHVCKTPQVFSVFLLRKWHRQVVEILLRHCGSWAARSPRRTPTFAAPTSCRADSTRRRKRSVFGGNYKIQTRKKLKKHIHKQPKMTWKVLRG